VWRCIVAVAFIALLAPVGVARGAVVQLRDFGALQITGLPGEANHLRIGRAADGTLTVNDDVSRLIPGVNCSGGGTEVRCVGPAESLSLEITTSDGDDRIAVDGSLQYESGYLSGGRGDDVVLGGAGSDLMFGNAGMDIVDGGAGDDEMHGGTEADVLRGGPGRDLARYDYTAGAVNVTLDDLPDDGTPGEGDNVATDVESVRGGGSARLVGSDGPNLLEVESEGPSELIGGGGDDRLVSRFGGVAALVGGPGRDRLEPSVESTVDTRDGEVDRVDCGEGLARPPLADPVDDLRGCVPPVGLRSQIAGVHGSRVLLRLRCEAIGQACRVRIELRRERRRLARATLDVPAGRSDAGFRLNRRGRAVMLERARMRVNVRVQAFRRGPPASSGFPIETPIELRRR
jgi:Ca2+-binding RTX toxin-like protein